MKYHLINSLSKLEALLGIHYDIPNRADFERLIFQHPLRFTDYLLEQIRIFPSIRKQYLPDPRELDPVGLEKPFTGIIQTGVSGLERMYLDRVILMPTSQCFAYCRFCFRKNYSHDRRKGDYGSPQDNFEKAYQYIRDDPRIKEVLITGGDPLMFPKKVLEIVEHLRQIPHLTGIRIGTRIFTSDPEQITKQWIKPWKLLNLISQGQFSFRDHTQAAGTVQSAKQTGCCRVLSEAGAGRLSGSRKENCPWPSQLSMASHINHPDELSIETVRSLLLCVQNHIPLYNQTVLLKGINDDPEILIKLCRSLRQLGVEPYRIYLADPLKGSEHVRVGIDTALEIKRKMRASASGRVVPSFMIDTRLGKIDLEEGVIHRKKGRNVFLKTPYTPNIYKSIDPDWKIPQYAKIALDGSLLVSYEDSL